ncbi:hypothetical protein SAMN05192553_101298 [Cyclobacterium xiamenense]|uniref:Glycosyl hydrolase family 67 N-terminus n=1 Tax=Cyclobacterium xiamenense TaxID=1297121 RepID=A0A1H6TNX3_9BACT|nr:hypothetical protein [Cyclobacterium xiamenense]SEI78887.1 hypothetical protein SAMN05192553_101298 [Cyclobacterium xiamenense]
MKNYVPIWLLAVFIWGLVSCSTRENQTLDLSKAVILVSPQIAGSMQETVSTILVEEIEKRSTIPLELGNGWESDTRIALALATDTVLFRKTVPSRAGSDAPEQQDEGYRIFHEFDEAGNTLWVIGADTRGILYGIGKLLRTADLSEGKVALSRNIDFSESPQYALRGHQFGYRNTANSWDAWTVEQFDQHFREQVLFGANSFENIPFQEVGSSPHFKVNPQQMELELSRICEKYDADYWVWTPAPRDLSAPGAPQEGLQKQEDFYARVPRLNAVFVPGGDPGDNHPSELIPYLEDLSAVLHQYHPDAGIWVSLQGFNEEKVRYFFDYLQTNNPDWLAGVVNGPSSPPVALERELLPEKYLHRFYPDITHTVRCHYPVENWDQAYALTLGREPCNPQPEMYTRLFNRDSPHTDGFITYSDGTHDDVNKAVWSQLGWDPGKDPETIVREYTRFFFGAELAEKAALGIFALEDNWDGPILENPDIEKTLALWKKLEAENPELAGNWRWQQLLMRAHYDGYIKKRLAFEKKLETEAYAILAKADSIGADQAIEQALQRLQKVETEPVSQDLKEKVFAYGEMLFQSVGAQTSVEKYGASGAERGAILDFIDYPLNNRWWLEDEFEKVRSLGSEAKKLARLDFIQTYEYPGEGSFYDNISSADAKHVTSKTDDAIDFLWENNGINRKRLSTQLFQFTPTLSYDELDPNSDYLIRVSGYGEALLRANGQRLTPTKYEKGYEEFKEFPLPKELISDGKLEISFDKPDEEHLNWRQQSRVTDVWVIKQ